MLIVGDFNIHVDNTNDALGLAFTDLINSFGVKLNVTHRFNHKLDLILSHGIDLTYIDIVPQRDEITDHFLGAWCILLILTIAYCSALSSWQLLFQPLIFRGLLPDPSPTGPKILPGFWLGSG